MAGFAVDLQLRDQPYGFDIVDNAALHEAMWELLEDPDDRFSDPVLGKRFRVQMQGQWRVPVVPDKDYPLPENTPKVLVVWFEVNDDFNPEQTPIEVRVGDRLIWAVGILRKLTPTESLGLPR